MICGARGIVSCNNYPTIIDSGLHQCSKSARCMLTMFRFLSNLLFYFVVNTVIITCLVLQFSSIENIFFFQEKMG